ncbi:MAG TPA: hypothetical protein VGM43_23130 [Bryobacteraceae bacterium]
MDSYEAGSIRQQDRCGRDRRRFSNPRQNWSGPERRHNPQAGATPGVARLIQHFAANLDAEPQWLTALSGGIIFGLCGRKANRVPSPRRQAHVARQMCRGSDFFRIFAQQTVEKFVVRNRQFWLSSLPTQGF